jgi:hypothetical protein
MATIRKWKPGGAEGSRNNDYENNYSDVDRYSAESKRVRAADRTKNYDSYEEAQGL